MSLPPATAYRPTLVRHANHVLPKLWDARLLPPPIYANLIRAIVCCSTTLAFANARLLASRPAHTNIQPFAVAIVLRMGVMCKSYLQRYGSSCCNLSYKLQKIQASIKIRL